MHSNGAEYLGKGYATREDLRLEHLRGLLAKVRHGDIPSTWIAEPVVGVWCSPSALSIRRFHGTDRVSECPLTRTEHSMASAADDVDRLDALA